VSDPESPSYRLLELLSFTVYFCLVNTVFNGSFAYGGFFCPAGQFLAYFSVTNNVWVKCFRHILGKSFISHG